MMTDETILLIDADMKTEDRIVSILEAEGYMVFASSGSKVNAEMVKKFRPSLIYLKPLAPSAAGFEVCRTIHTMEALRDVPIVILASLKGPIDSRYTAYYGIVDHLRVTFTPEELIEKTASVINRQQTTDASADIGGAPAEEPVRVSEEARVTAVTDENIRTAGRTGAESIREPEPAVVKEEWHDEVAEPEPAVVKEEWHDEIAEPDRFNRTEIRYDARQSRRQSSHSSIKVILLVVTAVIALIVAGFVLYMVYVAPPKAAKKVTPPVQPQKQEAVAEHTPAAAAPPTPVPPPAAQTPVQAPEQPSLPQQAAKPFFAVQIGAFKTEATAGALAEKFRGKGYEAFVQKGPAKGSQVVYRVLVGRFADRKEAVRLSEAVASKEGIKTTIFNHGQ